MAEYSNPYQGFLDSAGSMFSGMFGGGTSSGLGGALFGGTPTAPAAFNGGSSGNGIAGSIADIYDQYQTSQSDRNLNNQVQGMNAQQQAAIQGQLTAMQQQAAKQRADAEAAYNEAKGRYGTQNQGLEGNIATMTSNLNALNDPNSAYMQQARQAIERKDASAGRRSQWGEREVQLAGTLADYVGKYAPGINNSITAARDEINKNNTSLASIYDTMNKSGSLSDVNITSLINAINEATKSASTTGRQAANAAQGSQASLTQSALGGASGLIKALMGSLGGGSSGGITDWYGNNASQQYGVTGMGNYVTDNYGFGSNNYGPAFGGTSISDGLMTSTNPFGYTSGLTNGGGDYYYE